MRASAERSCTRSSATSRSSSTTCISPRRSTSRYGIAHSRTTAPTSATTTAAACWPPGSTARRLGGPGAGLAPGARRMQSYLLKRLLVAIPSLVIASLIVFTLPRLLPGDAVQLMIEEKAYAKDVDELRAQLGLDRPIYVQYFTWLGNLARGELGESLWTKRAVAEELARRLPVTLLLGLMSIAFAIVIALPIGVLAAVRADTVRDYVARSVAILGLSVPGFWLATLVIILPAMWWGWTDRKSVV